MFNVWNTASAIIVSFGGAAAIVCAVIKFSSSIIADRLSKKYQLEIDIKLEKIKSELENKNYVSKVRFDREFETYQELSERRLELVFTLSELKQYFYIYLHKRESFNNYIKKENLTEELFFVSKVEKLKETWNKNNFSNRKFAPFISEEMYMKIDTLNKSCSEQIHNCNTLINCFKFNNYEYIDLNDNSTKKTCSKNTDIGINKTDTPSLEEFEEFVSCFSLIEQIKETFTKVEERQNEISNMSDILTKDMRTYIKKLEAKD